MARAGLNAGHALLIGQLLTLLVDLLRQERHAEQIHILEAVGLPQLCLLGENVFGVVHVEVHGGHQGRAVLLVAGHIEAARVYVAQPVDGFLSRHTAASLHLITFLMRICIV